MTYDDSAPPIDWKSIESLCQGYVPYEGYSYLEDLMCWCIGVAAAKWETGVEGIVITTFSKYGFCEMKLRSMDYDYLCIQSDSLIGSLKGLLLKLVEE